MYGSTVQSCCVMTHAKNTGPSLVGSVVWNFSVLHQRNQAQAEGMKISETLLLCMWDIQQTILSHETAYFSKHTLNLLQDKQLSSDKSHSSAKPTNK